MYVTDMTVDDSLILIILLFAADSRKTGQAVEVTHQSRLP